MYKTVVVKYSPKAKEMAARIEDTANKMEQEGFPAPSCHLPRAFWCSKEWRQTSQLNKALTMAISRNTGDGHFKTHTSVHECYLI